MSFFGICSLHPDLPLDVIHCSHLLLVACAGPVPASCTMVSVRLASPRTRQPYTFWIAALQPGAGARGMPETACIPSLSGRACQAGLHVGVMLVPPAKLDFAQLQVFRWSPCASDARDWHPSAGTMARAWQPPRWE